LKYYFWLGQDAEAIMAEEQQNRDMESLVERIIRWGALHFA
jgi:hypothetical protein